jgi:Na+-driven multidrug efflux pump
MIGWSIALGGLLGVVMLALTWTLPHAFTDDVAVIDRAQAVWPLFALMQPLAGLVFALDGILIGAGDTRFLMWSMLVAGVGVYVPIALASLHFEWGIVGVWCGLIALLVARAAALGARFAGRRWAVVGAP